ncbi:MAG: hypothetical protein V1884_00050 [Candidatus Omnitrophota bacterium]
MKRGLILVALTVFLSGCATYKFQQGAKPYDKGYVVSRDGYAIAEYTIGKNNSVPDLQLAKRRFKRRKNTVEHYYKKMGCIENRFKMTFVDPCIMFLKAIGGVFRLPLIAISDYKYEHNPEYREKIIKREEEQDAKEEVRIQRLKDTLNIYIEKKITQEGT